MRDQFLISEPRTKETELRDAMPICYGAAKGLLALGAVLDSARKLRPDERAAVLRQVYPDFQVVKTCIEGVDDILKILMREGE